MLDYARKGGYPSDNHHDRYSTRVGSVERDWRSEESYGVQGCAVKSGMIPEVAAPTEISSAIENQVAARAMRLKRDPKATFKVKQRNAAKSDLGLWVSLVNWKRREGGS